MTPTSATTPAPNPAASPAASPEGPGARQLSLIEACLPIATLVGLLVVAAAFGHLRGEILVAILLISAAVGGWIARRQGKDWEAIQTSTGEKLAGVLPAILILLAVGLLIATWVLSGTIPFLVFWGVRLVSAEHLPLTAFLATAAMSLCTGTSWGSAGTLGVALMGTAGVLGVPLPLAAGAVVSGAYLGDKMSPLSDSTNISAIGAGTPLYTHIRHMLYTAVPSFVLAALVFGLAKPAASAAADSGEAARLLNDLGRVFELGGWVLLPLLVVLVGIVVRLPPALAMALSAVVAMALGVVLQGFDIPSALIAAVAGFRLDMLATAGIDPASLGPAFATLVQRGGLYSLGPTLIVILAAFLLAATMDVSGSLDLLIRRLLSTVRSTFGLIAATMAAGSTMIALTSHGGVTSLVIGGLFQKPFDERRLARRNLSRTLEDSVTLVEPLMPWTVSATFMASTLGVATFDYAPWAVFCYGGPFFSLLWAALYSRTGFGLTKTTDSPT